MFQISYEMEEIFFCCGRAYPLKIGAGFWAGQGG
jgi:hypothetical protein